MRAHGDRPAEHAHAIASSATLQTDCIGQAVEVKWRRMSDADLGGTARDGAFNGAKSEADASEEPKVIKWAWRPVEMQIERPRKKSMHVAEGDTPHLDSPVSMLASLPPVVLCDPQHEFDELLMKVGIVQADVHQGTEVFHLPYPAHSHPRSAGIHGHRKCMFLMLGLPAENFDQQYTLAI